jgi:hypothetical protein
MELVQISAADSTQAADLVEQYSDLPLGTADVIVIAIASPYARYIPVCFGHGRRGT